MLYKSAVLCRTGPGLKTSGSGRARSGLGPGSGLAPAWLGPGSLFSKIGLGLLLNKQISQARGPSPKPRPIVAQAFGLFSKSPIPTQAFAVQSYKKNLCRMLFGSKNPSIFQSLSFHSGSLE
jgi:hypothetical protein